MRIPIWLSIVVFVSTLFWPQLLGLAGLIIALFTICILFLLPAFRSLITLPATAIYYTIIVTFILFGGIFEESAFNAVNNSENTSLSHEFSNNVFGLLTEQDTKADHIITVNIKSLVNHNNSGYFIANVTSINDLLCNRCPLLEMRWYQPDFMVQAGQTHRFKVRIKPLWGKGNPNGFDRQKWRYSQHIAFVANIKEHLAVVDKDTSLRASFYQHALKLTASFPQQGALIALTFADKSLIDEQTKLKIKQLGIAHLFAISGLHIGLLFVLSFVVFAYVNKKILPVAYLGWFSWRLTHIMSFFVCLFYGYLSGFSLPTQRALLMLLLGVVILSQKRQVSRVDILAVCLWGILLLDPLAVLSMSLWLSFYAISCILFFLWFAYRPAKFSEASGNILQLKSRKLFLYIKWLFILQLVLTILMLPIQLVGFSAVSLLGFFINLIAIPLFSWLIIPLCLIAIGLLYIIEPLGLILFTIADFILQLFFHIFSFAEIGYLELSDLTINLVLSAIVLMLVLGVVLLFRCFLKLNRLAIMAVIGSLFAYLLTSPVIEAIKEKETWRVAIFDIGQGLAVLVSNEGEHLLYDTGPSYPPNYASAKYEILPYLQAQGITELNYLFVSHSDNDHAGGAKVINSSIVVNQAYSGEAKMMNRELDALSSQSYKQCEKGQVLSLGKLTVQVLAPTKITKNSNNNSCVLRVGDGEYYLLLTGDIHHGQEKQLIKQNLMALKADILLAPHHGSNTSSSNEFIDAVSPTWVVFTTGYLNRWGFPKSNVMQRYQNHGAQTINTSDTGFIQFNMQNQEIEVKTYREDLSGYWYHQQILD